MKLTAESIRNNIDYYTGIFTITEDAIISINEQFEIIDFNKGAEKIFGYTKDECLNKALEMLLPSRFRPQHGQHLKKFSLSPVKAKYMTQRKTIFGLRKNGEEFPANASISKNKFKDQWIYTVLLRDATKQDQIITALEWSKASLAEAQRIAHLGHWDWDILNNSLFWSDEIYRIFGLKPRAFEGSYQAFLDRVHPRDLELVTKGVELALANEQTYSIDHRIILPDKTIRYVHEQAEVYFDENNVPTRMTGTVQDITEQKITEERLQLSAKVFETSKDAIIITDHHANILEVNPSFTAITGYSRGEVLGKNVQILRSGKHPTEFYRQMVDELNQTSEWQGEVWDRKKSGEIYPAFLAISKVPGKHTGMSNYVGIFSDLSVIKKSEEKINYLTNYDILTNLPNRILFRDLLQQNIHRLEEDNQCLAVIFLDIDHFKLINESLGIDAGDKLLCLVAERLNDCLSNKATLGRLGGDHFGIILDDLSNARHAATAAQKIINNFSQHFTLNNENFFIDISLGITVYPDDGKVADNLLKNADVATNYAKRSGKNSYSFFSKTMNVDSLERLKLSTDLHLALERDEFVLHYQPQVDLETKQIVGVEALIRWQHPEKGLIPPGNFIPIIEETGLILPVGEWIIRTACKQAKEWQNLGMRPLRMSVNISPVQFSQKNFVDTVKKYLDEVSLSAEYLELELTENILMADAYATVTKLNKLKELNINLSIDDFGTGYSSLSYLKKFPIDVLKIDQSFIRDLTVDSEDAAIAAAIISMGHDLNIRIIAEGVEQEEHIFFLQEHGCDEIQGFYVSRALSSTDFVIFLNENKKLW